MQHDVRLAMKMDSGAADSWAEAILPQFLDMTASRQIEMDIERATLVAGGDAKTAAREIGKIAHKIAGTAASFGFAPLGRQAQAVEGICMKVCALSGAELDAAVKMRMLPALDALTQELDLILVTPL